MPRLDVRVKTELPAKAICNKKTSSVIISEFSLSGALVNGLNSKHTGIITIKPEFGANKNIALTGEIIRKNNGTTIIEFYHPDRYAGVRAWQYIKQHLSLTEECPYCNNKNSLGADHCGSCGWLLDFNDIDYLDKHNREIFVPKILRRACSLDPDQMHTVINFMDTELRKKRMELPGITCPYGIEHELRGSYCFESILGHHPKMIAILKLIAQVADTAATVLIYGESGTGKELIARALHYNSRRKNAIFATINCGALPENLLDTELFGHVRGAFTGAIKDKAGWFEHADKGTIFLDEISEMPAALQVKLLRILQTGEYSRVGSTKINRCDVRILAATNRNLKNLVREGTFREDLYYRLNVLDIELPPLRERKCDIPLLIQHLLKIFSAKYAKPHLRLTKDAEALILAYDFPGNIRELENIIQRAVLLAESSIIETRHLPADIRDKSVTSLQKENKLSSFKLAKQQAVEQFERKYISDCLKTTSGNISRAAFAAGINVKNFYEKMTKYGIDPHSFKNFSK